MSIDPGLGGTGWAMWKNENLVASSSIKPKGKPGCPWEERARLIIVALSNIVKDHKPDRSFIEQPFIALDGGRAEISAKRQDVVKLSILNGMITQALPNCYQVRVIDWKGQLPKDVFKRRIMKYLGEVGYRPTTETSHELDAIGIGRYITMKAMEIV